MKTYIMTEDQQMVCDLSQNLAGTELKARSEKVDHERSFPAEGMGYFAEAGLIGCCVPEEKGGAGLGHMSQVIALREAARECGSTAYAMALTSAAAACAASSENKAAQELVEAVLGGASATAATEDPVAVVSAQEADGEWILTGTVKNVPAAADSAYILVPVKTNAGASWIIAAQGQEGLKITEQKQLLGMKGCTFYTLTFNGCKVSREAVLSGNAAEIYQTVFTLYMAAVASGIAAGALKEAIAYDNQRVQFGKKIAQFENTQQVLAQMLAQSEASAALVYGAAQVLDAGENAAVAAAMAKSFAADVAARASKIAVQLMGGYGYSREYPVERKMRDAKMTEILGGETAAQQFVIAKALVAEE